MSTEVLSVPSSQIGLVIGKAGAGLRDIKSTSGVTINVPRAAAGEDTRTIELTGTDTQIEHAKSLITEMTSRDAYGGGYGGKRSRDEQPSAPLSTISTVAFSEDWQDNKRSRADVVPALPQPYQMGFYQPSQMQYNEPQTLYGAQMHSQTQQQVSQQQYPAPMPPQQYAVAAMPPQPYGSTAMGFMSAAEGNPLRVLLGDDTAGLVVVRGGEGLRQLKTASGATLDLPRDKIRDSRILTISGTVMQQHACCCALLDRVFRTSKSDFTMLLPTHCVGLLVGKGGAGLRELKAGAGVTIELQKEEIVPGERMLTLSGSALQVVTAMERVLAILGTKE